MSADTSKAVVGTYQSADGQYTLTIEVGKARNAPEGTFPYYFSYLITANNPDAKRRIEETYRQVTGGKELPWQPEGFWVIASDGALTDLAHLNIQATLAAIQERGMDFTKTTARQDMLKRAQQLTEEYLAQSRGGEVATPAR